MQWKDLVNDHNSIIKTFTKFRTFSKSVEQCYPGVEIRGKFLTGHKFTNLLCQYLHDHGSS